jgi:hypothetical protein
MLRSARTLAILPIVPIALIGITALSGCTSKKDKAREEVREQAGSLREELAKMPPQIDATMKRMMAATAGQNPRRADDSREFSRSLATLRDQARLVAREANLAEVDSAKYFTAWAKQVKKTPTADRPDARAASAASRARADQALSYLDKARADFLDLVSHFDNVEKGLARDGTERGIAAVQADVNAAISKATDVRNRIDRLEDELDAALAAN